MRARVARSPAQLGMVTKKTGEDGGASAWVCLAAKKPQKLEHGD